MNQYFDDIIDKLGQPTWYDKCGYPRYCAFEPQRVASIYASIVFLVRIQCQECRQPFDVAIYFQDWDLFAGGEDSFTMKKLRMIAEDAKIPAGKLVFSEHYVDLLRSMTKPELENFVHYGDPPNHTEECAAGSTMNCEEIRIAECWVRKKMPHFGWERLAEFEINFI